MHYTTQGHSILSSRNDIQFKARTYEVKVWIGEEVNRSGWANRTQFFNDLIDLLSAIPLLSGGTSKLRELKVCLSIYKHLPGERIRRLASRTNRTFVQMAVYIFKVGYESVESASIEPLLGLNSSTNLLGENTAMDEKTPEFGVSLDE